MQGQRRGELTVRRGLADAALLVGDRRSPGSPADAAASAQRAPAARARECSRPARAGWSSSASRRRDVGRVARRPARCRPSLFHVKHRRSASSAVAVDEPGLLWTSTLSGASDRWITPRSRRALASRSPRRSTGGRSVGVRRADPRLRDAARAPRQPTGPSAEPRAPPAGGARQPPPPDARLAPPAPASAASISAAARPSSPAAPAGATSGSAPASSRSSGATARAVTDVERAPARAASSARPRTTSTRSSSPSVGHDLVEERRAPQQRLDRVTRRSGRAIASTSPGRPAPQPTSATAAPGRARSSASDRAVEQVPLPQPGHLARPDQARARPRGRRAARRTRSASAAAGQRERPAAPRAGGVTWTAGRCFT